jgi:hypothetical protein
MTFRRVRTEQLTGAKVFWIAGFGALLVTMGCSAMGDSGNRETPLNGVVGGGEGGSPAVQPPYTGACPAQYLNTCKACHDGRGTAATPMGLLFWEDFHAPSHANASAQVFQILSERLHRTTPTPMPPDGTLDATKLGAIDAWTQAGAPFCDGFTHRPVPGGAGGAPVVPGGGGVPAVPGGGGAPAAGSAGTGGARSPVDPAPYVSPDGSYFIKEPPGNLPLGPDAPGSDYCFNIVAHNGQTPLPSDPSAYQVKASEYYHNFQFKVPYDKPVWALSTRPIIDNNKVLHHWLLFQMGAAGTDGSHADEIGLQLNNALLTGWAPGGNPLDMPPGVGLEMPAPGGFISIELHYYNTTGVTAADRSGVRMCVTYTKPTNAASLTWLGTEAINVPANQTGSSTGTCSTWKKNVDVHVIQTVPHMHKLGSHMKTVINHAAGGTDTIVDKDFVFTDQRAYAADVVIKANDTMATTCTWKNTTAAAVGFGTSTTAEMCYNFVIYYPAHALDGVGGIEGSKNMCLF